MKRIQYLIALFMLCTVSLAWAGVDINQADAQALAAGLKGVGAKKAQAIVEYRNTHGRFKTADELAGVKGISLKTIEKNRDNIELSKQ